MNNIKVVTICGSMKFEDEMIKVATDLEIKYGWCVLQCVYNFNNISLSKNDMDKIKKAHYKRISISDAIYVLNINGYIGQAVTDEIIFAKKLNKQIIYHEKLMD